MVRRDVVQSLKEEIARGELPSFLAGVPVAIKSAPGRLDVLGGLGADSGGTVAQMALPARVGVAVQLRDDSTLVIRSEQIGPPVGSAEVGLAIGSFYRWGREGAMIAGSEVGALVGSAGSWAMPVAALWHLLMGEFTGPGGMGGVVVIRGDVPLGAGQASSTALLCALVLAVCVLTGIAMGGEAKALLVQRAERISSQGIGAGMELSGTGHLLDATTSLLATPGAMLRYSTQPFGLVGAVPVPGDVRVLALDTGVRYTSARETLEELRIAGIMGRRIIETIYVDLGQVHTPLHGYLANTSPLLYRQYFRALLPKRMRAADFVRTYGALPVGAEGADVSGGGKLYRVRTAVDHLIAEHEHAEQFLQAMEEVADLPGDEGAERQKILQRAGRLALASHHSYRLRLELSCREADWLVDRLMEAGPERGM
ncbi:MAG: GHMP family kinase ATP-binding protein [Phycisphaerae bacterium]